MGTVCTCNHKGCCDVVTKHRLAIAVEALKAIDSPEATAGCGCWKIANNTLAQLGEKR